MADSLTAVQRSVRMGLVKDKNTKPELLIRSIIHKLGYRFRLHTKDVPGRPDLVFGKRKKAVFIHGCFWHRHSDPACRLTRTPKTRLDFWTKKFETNQQRDLKVQADLRAIGWTSLVIWECQLSNINKLKDEIILFLGETH